MKKIDFLISLPPQLLLKVAVELTKMGHSVGIYSGDSLLPASVIKEINALGNHNIHYINTKELFDRFNMMDNHEIGRYAKICEERYQLSSLRNFVFPHKCYLGEDENELMHRAIKSFLVAEKLFKDFKIRCVFQCGGGEVYTLALAHVARKNNVPFLFEGESYFPGRMIIYEDEMSRKMKFNLKNYEDMTSEERIFIDKHFGSLCEEKKIMTMTFNRSILDKILFRIKLLSEILKGQLSWKYLSNFLSLRLTRILRYVTGPFIYSTFNKKIKYIYFPLHCEGDTAISLRNPLFYKQEFIVELLARSLPQGYTLYIKEHPHPDAVNLSYLGLISLSKINNIEILPKETNSHDVIRNAEAVAVINSTVGFEALHYFKPVIILGKCPLAGKGVTFDVDNLTDVPKVIKEALNSKVDQEKVKSVIFSLWSSMYEGTVRHPSDENCSRFARSLVKKAKELGVEF